MTGSKPLVPHTADSVAFLMKANPNSPNTLVALAEGAPPVAKTFEASDDMARWIARYQGRANLYWHVNELRPGVHDRKAKKADVHRARYLHVDIDDEGARSRIEAFSPRPTFVIFSGGGYQLFWHLQEPSTDLDRVERLNLALAEELGGDNCHNVDRIMRLPGTINVLNKKKRSAGRKPALAYLVGELTDWSRSYPLDAFTEHAIAPWTLGSPAEPADIPAHVELQDLPANLLPITRQLIEAGDDPTAPLGSAQARYPSRSEVVYRVACDLIEAGCGPETVASILLDPAYPISASVREKRNPRRYALRQVRNASEAVSGGWPDTDKQGRPRATYRNSVVAIRRLGLVGENDEFHHRKTLGGSVMQVFQGELSDDGCAVIRDMIIGQFHFDPGKTNTIDAATFVCLENTHHPIREYLDGLTWDGKPRIETWLIDYLSAPDTPLNRALSKLVLTAAVRRIREPGVKFDHILVLEGEQGTGKSTAIRILAGADNFSDQDILTVDSKQQMEAMEGIWIYEISELAGLNRSETNRVKAFASRQIDRGRPAYGHFRENRPRQTIFIGTTNEKRYLRDNTGNRRFSPVETGRIDLDGLTRDRDQLWAEAASVEKTGVSISLPAELWKAAAVEQEARMEDHPWQDVLKEIAGEVTNGTARVTTQEVFEHLGIDPERRQPYQQTLIAKLMVQLGWAGPKRIKVKGQTLRGYERSPTAEDEALTKQRQTHPKPRF